MVMSIQRAMFVFAVAALMALGMMMGTGVQSADAGWTKYCGHGTGNKHYHSGYRYQQIYISSYRATNGEHIHKVERHKYPGGHTTTYYQCPKH